MADVVKGSSLMAMSQQHGESHHTGLFTFPAPECPGMGQQSLKSVHQILILVTKSLTNQFKGGHTYFGNGFNGFSPWLVDSIAFTSTVRQDIMMEEPGGGKLFTSWWPCLGYFLISETQYLNPMTPKRKDLF